VDDLGGDLRPVGGLVLPGRITEMDDAVPRYLRILETLLAERDDTHPRAHHQPRGLDGAKVVFDAANGASVAVGRELLVSIGAEVVEIGAGDGAGINDGCGALHPLGMRKAVLDHGAAVGIAVDGDGDRVVLCDAQGRLYDGDAILWLLAGEAWPGPPAVGEPRRIVVGTVMTNLGLERALTARGIVLHRAAVGDSEVHTVMKRVDAPFGGEPSGHVLFAHGPSCADGLFAALRAIRNRPSDLGGRLAGYTPAWQAHRTVPGLHSMEPTLPLGLVADLEKRGARVVIRPSGTEPVLRVMVEHEAQDVAEAGAQALFEELGGG
jgi:phosphoglucosamine mutase